MELQPGIKTDDQEAQFEENHELVQIAKNTIHNGEVLQQEQEKSKFIVDINEVDKLSVNTKGQSSDTERGTWTRSADYVLALIGYGIGYGNFWRFPYLCMKNGGGAFLIPFVTCVVLCGVPLTFLETSIGQFSGKSNIQSWEICPLFKGIGHGMFIISVVACIYYDIMLAWVLYYLANSFRTELPWSTCNGWWNTDDCFVKGKTTNGTNETMYSAIGNDKVNSSTRHNVSSEEEFWRYNTLQISSGLGDFGTVPWHLVVCYIASWIFIFLCVMKGIKSVGKVVYVTVILPYILMIILLIKGLTLEGSIDGIIYYLKPDLNKMMTTQVWVEAALQVFFSMCMGWGPLITMSSYNKFNNNCLRDSLIVCFVGEGTSIFCGFVIFAILGFVAHDMGLPIEKVVQSGPGLGFVVYPQALSRLPIPQFWSILFYLMLVGLGIDTMFANVENMTGCIFDLFPRLRRRSMLTTFVCCCATFVAGLVFCTQGAMYLFQLIDWYFVMFAIPMYLLIECLIVGWIYGAERFCRDIQLMLNRDVPVIFRICWCLITPLMVTCCLVFSLKSYVPPLYGDYKYPPFAQAMGWTLSLIPVIPVIYFGITEMYRNKRHGSFITVLSKSIDASSEWVPHSPEHQKGYFEDKFSYRNMSWKEVIQVNILGDKK